jgi:ribosomal protein L21E
MKSQSPWRMYALIAFGFFISCAQVNAQGLSPMQKKGMTGSDQKAFRITIINPYHQDMKYELSAEDKKTKETQPDVKFTGRKGTLSGKSQRKILVLIPVKGSQREVRVCLQFPDMQETIRPRVCGDFTVVSYPGPERERSLYAPAPDGRGG